MIDNFTEIWYAIFSSSVIMLGRGIDRVKYAYLLSLRRAQRLQRLFEECVQLISQQLISSVYEFNRCFSLLAKFLQPLKLLIGIDADLFLATTELPVMITVRGQQHTRPDGEDEFVPIECLNVFPCNTFMLALFS